MWPDLPIYGWILFGAPFLGGPALVVLVAWIAAVASMFFERPIPWSEMRSVTLDTLSGLPKVVALTWVFLIVIFLTAMTFLAILQVF